MLSVHRNAIIKIPGPNIRRVFPVDVMKVHPVVMERARIIAHGDHTRIRIISRTEILVINHAGWKPTATIPSTHSKKKKGH